MSTAPPQITTPRADAPPVAFPRTAEEALEAARAFAARLSAGAAERDRTRELPRAELRALADTGLLTLPVPASEGGPGASTRTIVDVFRILSAADPALTQVVQPHFSFTDTLARFGRPETRRIVLDDVLRGARVGNALSERGGKHAFDFRTKLTPRGDGTWLLSGRKYYSTGALYADWVAVMAFDESGEELITAYVPGDTPGLSVGQDWTAFGQRATLSGTTELEDVVVPDELIIRYLTEQDDVPTTVGAYAQILHGAIDAGIARGALEDGVAFARDRARPHPASGVARVADEVSVQERFGHLLTLVEAAEEYLGRAADLMDIAAADPNEETVAAARLTVGRAKAFAGDVALEVSTGILDAAGSSAADEKHGLDRHWRNARTHTLHDPNRWKYIHSGRHLLDGVVPPASDHTL